MNSSFPQMSYWLIAIVILLALNVAATRHVRAHADEHGAQKLLFTIAIWLLPFMGAFSAYVNVRAPRPQGAPAAPAASPGATPIPEKIAGPQGNDFPVLAHMFLANNVPMMDWKALSDWAAEHFDAAAAKVAIEQGRRIWLMHLREATGPHARLVETQDALILTSMEPAVAAALAEYVSTTRQRILKVLKGIAQLPAGEKTILIVMDSEEDYYQYVANFYPEDGEFAMSGGMFIDAGCPHFLTVRNELSAVEPVIAHEMTHLSLSRLNLPKWLDEGIAVNTERRVAGFRGQLYTPRELHAKHLGFWNAGMIQQFWSGESFDRTDDGNLLSYDLGRIIVEQMGKQWDGFVRFVNTAQREDGGAAAAHEAFGADLGEVASVLLEDMGDEDWSPDPAQWYSAQAVT
ncbi:hypothetical protein VVD49_12700 [Uliginosibacterium sp. H3]|uniref:Peptidase MA superfamily protein n=1 Tax=Uliginosibacterium silvisoli TaxID=3114758 RepID=A0ABU6K468_9RHOO|nr:hypothetical protein [Uliginosibacterium sp. H3]